MTKDFAAALARLMLRTASSPLSMVWSLAYASVMRAAAVFVRRDYPDASIYLKGSFASREPVYGVSDVDLVVVIPDEKAPAGSLQKSAREAWKQICNRTPLLRRVIQHCWFYEERDLQESIGTCCLTSGLESDEADDRAVFLGSQPLHDHMGLQTHPSIYGPLREWRRMAGPDRLPTASPGDVQSRRLAAWLHLQYWWRHAFQACADPSSAHVPLLCVKLIAEPVRLWLWVERGERVSTREASLARGLAELPEERETFELALRLLKALPRSPAPPLAEAVAALLRGTERLGQHMLEASEETGHVDVRLTGADDILVTPQLRERAQALSGKLLPLADWRALAVPGVPDEALWLLGAARLDPASLAEAARADNGDAVPCVHYNSMMLLPTINPERGLLRSVQCEPSDPVSMALSGGRAIARFPRLAGWSAMHTARRAVAEHRGWLRTADWVSPPHGWVGTQSAPDNPTMRTLGLLFTAARAALFLESVHDGDPELAVTASGAADRLVARDPGSRAAVEDALNDLRAMRAVENNVTPRVGPLLDVVRSLPAYSQSAAFAMAVR